MLDFVLLLSIALGFFLGVCSGLTPGLHTNNFAALLLALSPALLSLGLEPHHLAVVILAASIAHTFLDIIPSVFIGAPDPEWGEKLVAYVVPREGTGINETDVTDYVERHLASYKKPKEVIFADELPYSPSGKQLKRILRDEYTRERTVKDAGK